MLVLCYNFQELVVFCYMEGVGGCLGCSQKGRLGQYWEMGLIGTGQGKCGFSNVSQAVVQAIQGCCMDWLEWSCE